MARIQVRLAPSADHIICRAIGLLHRQDFKRILPKLKAYRERMGISQVLLDVRHAINTSNALDTYEFVHQDLAKFAISELPRIAMLAKPRDRSHDFALTVLQNAGFKVERFESVERAEVWLGVGIANTNVDSVKEYQVRS